MEVTIWVFLSLSTDFPLATLIFYFALVIILINKVNILEVEIT